MLEAVTRASALPATLLHARAQHNCVGAALGTAAQGAVHTADRAAEASDPAQNGHS